MIVAAGPDRVAAVFAEPVPGPGGVLVPPDGYWPRVRALCDRYGVLLAADEVVTGCGRTGRWCASDHWGLVPDLMILGKGLTGGYQSLAAVVMRRPIGERLAGRQVPHGFTYSGHPAAAPPRSSASGSSTRRASSTAPPASEPASPRGCAASSRRARWSARSVGSGS